METNKIKDLVNYDELTKEEKEILNQTFEECATIFAAAILCIEKQIDLLFEKLTKEENE